jgi:signal transduction histidine kinase
MHKCEVGPNADWTAKGYGLGVAQEPIEQRGSRIWYALTQGRGTTFAFELPRYEDLSQPLCKTLMGTRNAAGS